MNKTILTFLVVLLISGAVTLPLNIVNAQTPNYTLVAFSGDWSCNSEAGKSFAQVKNSNADLLVVLGDTSYGSNMGCFKTLISDNGLQSKTIGAIGNHDAPEDGSASFETEIKQYFQLGDTGYRTFEVPVGTGKAVFIALNTQLPISSGSAQYNWLKSTLDTLKPQVESGQVKYVIPFEHKMIWNCGNSCSSHGTESYSNDAKNLLYQYGSVVDTFLQGHEHSFMVSKPLKTGNSVTTTSDLDGVTFFVSGLAGRSPDGTSSPSGETLEAFGGSSNLGVSYMKLYNDEKKIESYFVTNSGTTKAQHLILGDTIVPPKEICNDGIDNDGDGLIDTADPDCAIPPKEICNNGVDDDLDGLIDAEDTDCPAVAEICNNGLDDDRDGLKDANDPDCQTAAEGELKPINIVASKQDSGKEAILVNDNNYDTRWSGDGDGQTIEFTFNSTYAITKVGLTGFHYDKSYKFEINGKQFTNNAGREQGKLIMYDLSDLGINSDKVKIIGHGNSGSSYNSYREIHFFTDNVFNEICGNNIDDDKDGLIDEDCAAELCYDLIDNDGDGLIDENCPVQ